MKFVNKLSVIGLIVLMFSFMNILQADDGDLNKAPLCSGTSVDICANSKTQSKCEGTYRDNGKPQQCKWDASTSVCRANGNYCNLYY